MSNTGCYICNNNLNNIINSILYFPTIFCAPDWSHCVKTPTCRGHAPYCTRPGSKCWACAPCAPCHFM